MSETVVRVPRFVTNDILQAYYTLECDYNSGGWLHERPSNQRRREACSVQIRRTGWRPPNWWAGYESLTQNGCAIYHMLRYRYGFNHWDCWQRGRLEWTYDERPWVTAYRDKGPE